MPVWPRSSPDDKPHLPVDDRNAAGANRRANEVIE
jgi:hypothetical protein